MGRKYEMQLDSFGRLGKLFNGDSNLYAKFINTVAAKQTNEAYWKTRFAVSSTKTPTGKDGKSVFEAVNMSYQTTPMADLAADFSESTQIDKAGAESYFGSIPGMRKGFHYTTPELYAIQKEMELSTSAEQDVLKQYIVNLGNLITSVNTRLSNFSSQLISKGKVDTFAGTGLKLKPQIVPIPAANKYKAGTATWNTSSFKLLDRMNEIEQDVRDRTGYEGALVWEMPLKTVRTCILTNTQICDVVGKFLAYKNGYLTPLTSNININQFNEYAAGSDGYVSPIVVAQEKQYTASFDTPQLTSVSGWEEKNVVLRPAGYAGVMQYADIPEIVAQPLVTAPVVKTSAIFDGGVMGAINTVNEKAGYNVFYTDIIAHAFPALTQFMYHNIVDITQTT